MNVFSDELKITSFVVKVVSRCNINCDYCYVYKHVDQSYKKQPVRLSKAHITLFARRLDEYLSHSGVDTMRICLHGGEPLLAGLKYLENFFITLHQNIENIGKVRFAIQTNAVLLTREFLDLFRKYQVGISLSLDGPRSANDKHRLDHQGNSTYDKVTQAIHLLKTDYPELFLGMISVIDPTNDPKEIIDYFAAIDPPSYDLLFPDANHFVHPPLRVDHPEIYEEWIRQALRHWYTNHPRLSLRMFRNVCDAIYGQPTESEFFGNGNISYLILESDGSYHYSDLLKAAYEGASNTGLHVESAAISDVLKAQSIQGFQAQLLTENKCESCFKCPELNICGSGQIAHRFGPKGFKHPTTYCRETLAMITEARHLIFKARAAQMLVQPDLFRDAMMDTLFSEQSLYLTGAIMRKEVSLVSGLDAAPVMQLLQETFGNFIQECGLILSHHQHVLQDNNLFNSAEIILDGFLKRKFQLVNTAYPLAATGSELESVYRLAYRYRFWQSVIDRTPDAYQKACETKELLVAAACSLNVSLLSDMGRAFFNTLLNEFLQDCIEYQGNSYVAC